MRRTWLYCAVIALCPILALVAWRAGRVQADRPDDKAAVPQAKKLPYTQVVLFNTGLGYFQREGEVEGDTRIDLSVPASDINDILKTLVIDNGGKPVAINYEGTEPVETKLRTFQIDLATNPTLGQLLNQARGEKVEVTMENQGGATTQLTGAIVGMEATFENQTREVHHLNLRCADGTRRIALERVQRVRFLDPNTEDEYARALGVLSAGHADKRRLVSVRLEGEGKRKVKFGHVTETPIWKATYRLMLNGKSTLECRAVVENTTDEDWKDVRVTLVSGRPITFQMDLAQPLYVPRPKAETEVFASLRPPTAAPALGGNLGGFQGSAGGFTGSNGGNQLGMQRNMAQFNRQSAPAEEAFHAMLGVPMFGPGGQFNRYQVPPGTAGTRLTYDDLQKRRKEMLDKRRAEATWSRTTGLSLADLGTGIDDIISNADRIGEGFRYSVGPRVNLPRQKSSLLPVLDGPIELTRLSIYNPSVHPRFPLRAVQLKNSTGQHLQQGPAAVYDDGQYVGDAKLPDMQPGQERLISFAMDLGVEVRPEQGKPVSKVTKVEIHTGNLWVTTRQTRETAYKMTNRSKQERLVAVEHATNDWTLAEDAEKPAEKTRQSLRFHWKVAADKAERKVIAETRTDVRGLPLLTAGEAEMEAFAEDGAASAAVKQAVGKLLASRRKIAALNEEIQKAERLLKPLVADQERLVQAIPKLPDGSAAHKRSLARYDEQEGQIEKLQKALAEKRSASEQENEEYQKSAKTLTVK